MIGIIGFGLIFLFACGGSETAEPVDESMTADVVEAEAVDVDVATDVPTATPKPTATPTQTPTPVPADILLASSAAELGSAAEPIFLEDDEIVFDEVSSPEDGWLVIWPDSGGTLSADKAFGFVEIEAGVQENVTIELALTEIRGGAIQVALHSGRLADGDFAADADNLLLIQTLAVDTPASRPLVETGALAVSEDGFLWVDKVQSDGPGWLAVYDESGANLLGFAAVEPGESADVPVPIQWHVATTNIQLHLLQDLGNVTEFEDAVDLVAEFQGEPIMLELSVGLPADIVAFDQPMPDFVLVNRVTTPVDGYIVAFGDPDGNGQPDTILGSTSIKAGLSEYLEIDVSGSGVTEQVLLSLFSDSNESGVFDFPEDEPIRSGATDPTQILLPVRSDIEGVLAVDSIASAENLRVNVVATPVDAWLIVEKLPIEEGAPLVAQLRLLPGLQHGLDVPLESVTAGDTVRVKLYTNNPDLELFDPERNDFALLADERQIFVEVTIQ